MQAKLVLTSYSLWAVSRHMLAYICHMHDATGCLVNCIDPHVPGAVFPLDFDHGTECGCYGPHCGWQIPCTCITGTKYLYRWPEIKGRVQLLHIQGVHCQ